MKSTTVRVTEETHRTLRELSTTTGEPMQDILAEAVTAYWRRRLLEETNAAYAALRADGQRWVEEAEEREAWEATLGDTARDGGSG